MDYLVGFFIRIVLDIASLGSIPAALTGGNQQNRTYRVIIIAILACVFGYYSFTQRVEMAEFLRRTPPTTPILNIVTRFIAMTAVSEIVAAIVWRVKANK